MTASHVKKTIYAAGGITHINFSIVEKYCSITFANVEKYICIKFSIVEKYCLQKNLRGEAAYGVSQVATKRRSCCVDA